MAVSVHRCGEVTTSLTEGKREYFLNCMFCGRIFLTLDKFGKHAESVHLNWSDGYDEELLEDYKITDDTILSMDAEQEEVVNVNYLHLIHATHFVLLHRKTYLSK